MDVSPRQRCRQPTQTASVLVIDGDGQLVETAKEGVLPPPSAVVRKLHLGKRSSKLVNTTLA